ncbi:fungal specific transcription factor domain-containing protein [Sarocladium implicatum]|nr:fungal specific transcription factor domain-containing protein [Sarocladium implicatum]
MGRRRACDVCYRRKIQCLINQPGDACDWCSTQGLRCAFTRVTQKVQSRSAAAGSIEALSRRVQELEGALQSAQHATIVSPNTPGLVTSPVDDSFQLSLVSPRTTTSSLLSSSSTPSCGHPSASPVVLSRCHLGCNWYFKGVGILSSRGRQWISEGAGERLFLEKFDIFDNPSGVTAVSTAPTSVVRPISLPAEPISRRLFSAFLETKTSILFPVLDENLFNKTITRAYDITSSDLVQRASAEACVWAMLAVAGRSEHSQQADLIPEPEQSNQQVKRLLAFTRAASNIDNLQATLLLWIYQKTKSRCHEASTTFTSACRMVCDLGGHFHFSELAMLPQHVPVFDEPLRKHIRLLFMMIYCFDKEYSMRTGNPPLLTSDLCDMTTAGLSSHQCREVALAKVKESALRLLCSPVAFRFTDGDLCARIRQLDDELEDWRMSVELAYRPRLSIPSDLNLALLAATTVVDRTHLIKLQLDYLFTMINIHFLVRKCGNFERNLPDELHSAVHSSADLSLEASRSVFSFFDTVIDFWKQESVWIVAHYTLIAAMPLFINTLIHPLGQPADKDVQILSSVGSIARNVPTDGLYKEDIQQVQEVVEFVMELVRLCQSAAWKAKKGERELDLDIIHRDQMLVGR